MRVFIDTNILFDYVLKREKFYQSAEDVFKIINESNVACFTNPNNFQHAYFFLRKVLGSDTAKQKLISLRRIMKCAPYDGAIIDKALARVKPHDLEDAVTLEMALACEVEVFVTRDRLGFKEQGVLVMAPEDFVDYYYY